MSNYYYVMPTLIVRTLHIGCKGEGRPKANIRWYQLVQDSQSSDLSMIMMSDIINDTSLDVNITEPREGRSVLSINLPFVTEECQRYICEAENLGGRSLGGVDICTRRTYVHVYFLKYCRLRNFRC